VVRLRADQRQEDFIDERSEGVGGDGVAGEEHFVAEKVDRCGEDPGRQVGGRDLTTHRDRGRPGILASGAQVTVTATATSDSVFQNWTVVPAQILTANFT
jgi:hypothetical protein